MGWGGAQLETEDCTICKFYNVGLSCFVDNCVHFDILFIQESERKAYNPRGFCKVYTMDKQPLNTGEQKDMTEFFTDLITKLEEMSPEMVSHYCCSAELLS